MPILKLRKPRLPSHYYVFSEPPDPKGEEALYFISEQRRIKLKGRSFREFEQAVIPLLDGQHTIDEIENAVADTFRPDDLEAGLQLLAEQNLLEDAAVADVEPALEPQLNFFHEVSADPAETQRRLRAATVTVFGLGGPGATVALSLAAAHVGCVRCVDTAPVGRADPYLSPVFSPADVGRPRVDSVRRRVETIGSPTELVSFGGPFASDSDVAAAISGSQFVICAIDAGLSSLTYRLNRACLREGLRWTSCAASGSEVIVGPTVHPHETACYLCYKMRAVTCAENPEDEFAFQRFLDRRKKDDTGRRENLVFATNIAASFIGLEALKEITGVIPASTVGRVIVVDLIDMSMKKHVVLRKPWCPACFEDRS